MTRALAFLGLALVPVAILATYVDSLLGALLRSL